MVHIVAQARYEDGKPLKGPLTLDDGRIHHDMIGVVRHRKCVNPIMELIRTVV